MDAFIEWLNRVYPGRFCYHHKAAAEHMRKGWAACQEHNDKEIEALRGFAWALTVGEVGEAINKCRGAKPTPELRLELVDIILRTIDLMVDLGYPVEESILEKMEINKSRDFSKKLK
jgi:NTP pyrophosphatase (non-canonical NTP hydrolase)